MSKFSIYARQWSDHDVYFGPFTFAKEPRSGRSFDLVLESGSEEYPGAYCRASIGPYTVILALPDWVLSPYREKVYPKSWDEATVKRLGRNWYWHIESRKFGVSVFEGLFSIFYGRQSMDSRTEKRWGYFLPWTQWRHVRRSFYGIHGEHVATLLDTGKSYLGDPDWWERERKIEEATPTASFEFDDYDGERITARTMIEEREWKFGTGWWKWLSLFRKPKIRRSLKIDFSAETGERKGSWKGGTVGHGIEMKAGELHENAFLRYCRDHNMVFRGKIDEELSCK